MEEIYKRYRPKTFGQLVGSNASIDSLKKKLKKGKVPHSTLFVGDSGCGKTSTARILADQLGAKESDICEINSAHFKGIDSIRQIRQDMQRAPFGKCRVWILNEVHQYSVPVQDAMLEMLEDTPKHVYFMLTTTNGQKLQEPFKNRCTVVVMKKIKEGDMKKLIRDICRKEKKKLKSDVVEALIEKADGTPRKALVILDTILHLKTKAKQIEVIQRQDIKDQVDFLANGLIFKYWDLKWPAVQKMIEAIEEEGESIRYMMVAYCNKILLSPNTKFHQRAAVVMDNFSMSMAHMPGKSGVTLACYQLCIPKKRGK